MVANVRCLLTAAAALALAWTAAPAGLRAESSGGQQAQPFTLVDGGRCQFSFCVSKPFCPPRGKRMVIETFSFEVGVVPGERLVSASVRQRPKGGGTIIIHNAPISGPQPFTGGQSFVASQAVRLYPDPDIGCVVIAGGLSGGNLEAGFGVTISGYYLPRGSGNLFP
jgi:hypothetical protein